MTPKLAETRPVLASPRPIHQRFDLDRRRQRRHGEFMPTVEVTLNLSEQELAIAHEQRGAMPLDEFLSYCAAFGIADVRDQFQAQQRDYLAQTMHSSMAQHQRSRTQREASNIKELTRKKDDTP